MNTVDNVFLVVSHRKHDGGRVALGNVVIDVVTWGCCGQWSRVTVSAVEETMVFDNDATDADKTALASATSNQGRGSSPRRVAVLAGVLITIGVAIVSAPVVPANTVEHCLRACTLAEALYPAMTIKTILNADNGIFKKYEGCKTEDDCGGAGDCVAGACECDAAWTGQTCTTLALLPMDPDNGIRRPEAGSWGGSVVQIGKLFHMFVSDFGDCTLDAWQAASRITHAVSTHACGPFKPMETVQTPFAHNPTVHQTSDKHFVIYHITGKGHAHKDADCKEGGLLQPSSLLGDDLRGEHGTKMRFSLPVRRALQETPEAKIEAVKARIAAATAAGNADLAASLQHGLDHMTANLNMQTATVPAMQEAAPETAKVVKPVDTSALGAVEKQVAATEPAAPAEPAVAAEPAAPAEPAEPAEPAAPATATPAAGPGAAASTEDLTLLGQKGARLTLDKNSVVGVRMMSSTSVHGPWKASWSAPYTYEKEEPTLQCNNPAAWMGADDGSVMLYCKWATRESPASGFRFAAFKAANWRGPYNFVSMVNPEVSGEDPYVWFSKKRSMFHMIYHRMDPKANHPKVGSTAWSKDGINWRALDAPHAAFNASITLTTGQYLNTYRRERHQLLINDEGEPIALYNGVTARDKDYSRTTAQEIRSVKEDPVLKTDLGVDNGKNGVSGGEYRTAGWLVKDDPKLTPQTLKLGTPVKLASPTKKKGGKKAVKAKAE